MMRQALGKLSLAALLLGWLVPADRAEGRPGNWTWTADELKRIKALEAQVVRDKNGSNLLRAGRFDVRTNLSPRFAAETSLFMDLFYEGYCKFVFGTLKVAPPPPPAKKAAFASAGGSRSRPQRSNRTAGHTAGGPVYFPRKPTVVVLATEQEYKRSFTDGSGGRFLYRRDRKGRWTQFHIYTFAKTARQRQFRYFNHQILMHEGAHCMLNALAGKTRIPLWFNEGFSELLECWDLRALLRGQTSLKYATWQNANALNFPADGWYKRGPSLTKLLAIKKWNTDQMGSQTRYRYALAWNFMEFLFSTDDGRRWLRTMMDRIIRKHSPLLSERECWQLEPQWHLFLNKRLR